MARPLDVRHCADRAFPSTTVLMTTSMTVSHSNLMTVQRRRYRRRGEWYRYSRTPSINRSRSPGYPLAFDPADTLQYSLCTRALTGVWAMPVLKSPWKSTRMCYLGLRIGALAISDVAKWPLSGPERNHRLQGEIAGGVVDVVLEEPEGRQSASRQVDGDVVLAAGIMRCRESPYPDVADQADAVRQELPSPVVDTNSLAWRLLEVPGQHPPSLEHLSERCKPGSLDRPSWPE